MGSLSQLYSQNDILVSDLIFLLYVCAHRIKQMFTIWRSFLQHVEGITTTAFTRGIYLGPTALKLN